MSDKPENNWGFMFEDKQSVGFFSEHENSWDKVQSEQQGSIRGEGLFVYKEIEPYATEGLDITSSEFTWYVVSYITDDIIKAELKPLQNGLLLVMVIFGPILIIFGIFFGRAQVSSAWSQEQLEINANIDSLTGLNNRRSAFEYLNRHFHMSTRQNYPLSVIFIDVNHLKETNDTLGHEAGDELIIAASNCLKRTIRVEDMAARFGGDEFLLILPRCKKDAAVIVVERSLKEFSCIEHEGCIQWSFSYGVVTKEDKHANIEELISEADELMFESKRIYKENLRGGQ
jgi:diguanylate cyclase (GGDEF)-like protein